MRNKGLVLRHVLIVSVYVLFLMLSGCQQEVAVKEDFEPVFFPPPPVQPRLQFLTSYTGAEFSNTYKPSFLENYVLGDTSNVPEGMIAQPFGVAIHQGKIYVCDVGHNNIKVIDVLNKRFEIFPGGKQLQKPLNIFIEPNGTKYVADSKVGVVLVYSPDDKIIGFLGNQLGIKPSDLAVRDDKLYVTDANNNQVFVLDKRSGQLLQTIGKNMTDRQNWGPDEFALISGLALDNSGDVYVTDKLKGLVTQFAPDGTFLKTYSRQGSLPDCLVRSKGIDVDREDRLWVVDAGPSMAVKVFRNSDGRFLMIFGLSGTEPGQMYMPADIAIDYDNVDLFKDLAVEGADLECLVLVTNQYGPHKVSVYGFGTFPEKYSMQGVVTPTDKTDSSDTDQEGP